MGLFDFLFKNDNFNQSQSSYKKYVTRGFRSHIDELNFLVRYTTQYLYDERPGCCARIPERYFDNFLNSIKKVIDNERYFILLKEENDSYLLKYNNLIVFHAHCWYKDSDGDLHRPYSLFDGKIFIDAASDDMKMKYEDFYNGYAFIFSSEPYGYQKIKGRS